MHLSHLSIPNRMLVLQALIGSLLLLIAGIAVFEAGPFAYAAAGLAVLTLIVSAITSASISAGIARTMSQIEANASALAQDDADIRSVDPTGDPQVAAIAAALTTLAEATRERAAHATGAHQQARRVEQGKSDTINMLEEVNQVMADARSGNLSARITSITNDNAMAKLKEEINDMLAIFEAIIDQTSATMRALAAGDISKRMPASHHGAFATLAENVNTSQENLQDLVFSIQGVTNAIRSSTDTIVSGAHSLSERTESQAAALEETAATMEEMTATVKSNAAGAATADSLSSSTAATAKQGGVIASEAVEVMGSIQESANKIKEITTMVDGIAFQTNLLALNAAVEAARAGDAGKGFAVVAQEVRTLAQRAAEAAQDIGGLVSESIDHISRGVERVEATGQSLESIRDGIGDVATSISEITGASQEQATGIQEISTTISKLDHETQRNATLASDSATAAAALASEADRLTNLMGRFRTDPSEGARRAS